MRWRIGQIQQRNCDSCQGFRNTRDLELNCMFPGQGQRAIFQHTTRLFISQRQTWIKAERWQLATATCDQNVSYISAGLGSKLPWELGSL